MSDPKCNQCGGTGWIYVSAKQLPDCPEHAGYVRCVCNLPSPEPREGGGKR